MTSKSQNIQETLHFSQPKALRHAFVITRSNTQVGSLTYQGLSHRRARGAMQEQTWEFVQKGFLTTKISAINDQQKIVDAQDNALITYECGGFIKTGGKITVADAALPESVLALLIPLGLFIALNTDEDAAVVVAA